MGANTPLHFKNGYFNVSMADFKKALEYVEEASKTVQYAVMADPSSYELLETAKSLLNSLSRIRMYIDARESDEEYMAKKKT